MSARTVAFGPMVSVCSGKSTRQSAAPYAALWKSSLFRIQLLSGFHLGGVWATKLHCRFMTQVLDRTFTENQMPFGEYFVRTCISGFAPAGIVTPPRRISSEPTCFP